MKSIRRIIMLVVLLNDSLRSAGTLSKGETLESYWHGRASFFNMVIGAMEKELYPK
jgi:hypothetical protein